MEGLKLIFNLIGIGVMLLSAGGLIEVTMELRNKAVRTHQEGMMSLGNWNRKLLGPKQI